MRMSETSSDTSVAPIQSDKSLIPALNVSTLPNKPTDTAASSNQILSENELQTAAKRESTQESSAEPALPITPTSPSHPKTASRTPFNLFREGSPDEDTIESYADPIQVPMAPPRTSASSSAKLRPMISPTNNALPKPVTAPVFPSPAFDDADAGIEQTLSKATKLTSSTAYSLFDSITHTFSWRGPASLTSQKSELTSPPPQQAVHTAESPGMTGLLDQGHCSAEELDLLHRLETQNAALSSDPKLVSGSQLPHHITVTRSANPRPKDHHDVSTIPTHEPDTDYLNVEAEDAVDSDVSKALGTRPKSHSTSQVDRRMTPQCSPGRLAVSSTRLQVQPEDLDSTDWEFWGNLLKEYSDHQNQDTKDSAGGNNYGFTFWQQRHNRRKAHKALKQKICSPEGIPASLRGLVWQLLCDSKSESIEVLYSELLKSPSAHEKLIQRDLARTFPRHPFFRNQDGIGQESLFNVMKAYSLYDSEIGYCQGTSFIVGVLLLNMPDNEAFCVLVRLMTNYSIRAFFTHKMDGLHMRMYQLDKLLDDHLPALAADLKTKGISTSMFASEWMLTLYAYRFPLEMVFRFMDIFLLEGFDIMFPFTLALLKGSEPQILQLDFEDSLKLLKSESLMEPFRGKLHILIQNALAMTMNEKKIAKYAKEYRDMIASRPETSSPSKEQATLISDLHVELRTLTVKLEQSVKENERLTADNAALQLQADSLKILVEHEDQRQSGAFKRLMIRLQMERKHHAAQVQEMQVLLAKNGIAYTCSHPLTEWEDDLESLVQKVKLEEAHSLN